MIAKSTGKRMLTLLSGCLLAAALVTQTGSIPDPDLPQLLRDDRNKSARDTAVAGMEENSAGWMALPVPAGAAVNGPGVTEGKPIQNPEVTGDRVNTTPGGILKAFEPSAKERALQAQNLNGWKRQLPLVADQSVPVVINCYKIRGGTTYIRGRLEGDDLSLLAITISGGQLRGILSVPSLGSYAIRSDAAGVFVQPLQNAPWSCATGG